jgi:RNA polymerase sigma factor (sigma-70 family)
MSDQQVCNLTQLLSAAYDDAQTVHGNLDLNFEVFCSRVATVIEKHLDGCFAQSNIENFFVRFFLSDLYLSEACAQGNEAAWNRFFEIYQTFLQDLCCYCCASPERAEELADKVLADMFFADRSGRSRIASYDGRIPLSSWLAAVVRNQAINDARLKINQTDSLDLVEGVVDKAFAERIYADYRMQSYSSAIRDSLQVAAHALNDREQLLLLLKYEKELRSNEIAVTLGLSESTLSRQFQAIYKKLREAVTAALAGKHNFNDAAIAECLDEILENPIYSILSCDSGG